MSLVSTLLPNPEVEDRVYLSDPDKSVWKGFWESDRSPGAVNGTISTLLFDAGTDASMVAVITYNGSYQQGKRVVISLDRILTEADVTFRTVDKKFTIVVTTRTPDRIECRYVKNSPYDTGTLSLTKTRHRTLDITQTTGTPACTLL